LTAAMERTQNERTTARKYFLQLRQGFIIWF
jgi:hypothetical protein